MSLSIVKRSGPAASHREHYRHHAGQPQPATFTFKSVNNIFIFRAINWSWESEQERNLAYISHRFAGLCMPKFNLNSFKTISRHPRWNNHNTDRTYLLCIGVITTPVRSFVSFNFHCAQHYGGNVQVVSMQDPDLGFSQIVPADGVQVSAEGFCATLLVKVRNSR